MRVTSRQEKEAELFHSQRQKIRRKNPDQNTLAGNKSKLELHAQPTTLASSQHILHHPPPPFSRTHSLMHVFASPYRHQPQTPNYFETTMFETWAKRHEVS
jgi:hypothetical protein